MKIKKVSVKKVNEVIESRKPKGLFYTRSKEMFVACDNRTGDAWTEEFKTEKDCINFLK